MSVNLKGTGVALITPFHADGSIDYNALSRVVEHVIEGGVNYLVPLGSTGESATLSEEECRKVLNHVIKINDQRKPIIAGNFGGNDTRALVNKINNYDFAGIDGILSSSPAYSKPSQEGIYAHYMALQEISKVPILIYNVPGRTMSNISWETTIRLAENSDNFIGIKEASGNLIQAIHILNRRKEKFLVSSGDDEITLPFLGIGGDGVISVVANAFPDLFSKMVKAALNNNFDKARQYNSACYNLHKWLYIEGNPVGIKSAMQVLGLCKNYVRLPLSPMSPENYNHLKLELDAILSKPSDH